MKMRWNKKLPSGASPVTAVIRRPRSERNSTALVEMGPNVSQAIGTNEYVLESSAYLASFLLDALSDAPPDCWEVIERHRNWLAYQPLSHLTSRSFLPFLLLLFF